MTYIYACLHDQTKHGLFFFRAPCMNSHACLDAPSLKGCLALLVLLSCFLSTYPACVCLLDQKMLFLEFARFTRDLLSY